MHITHPWVRETPKGSTITAGYAKIKNDGKEDDRLIGASLKSAEKSELHATAIEEGVAKMRALPDGIAIRRGETVELKPGAFHIMFLGLKRPLSADEYVDGSLMFEKAGKVSIDFYVEPLASEQGPNDGGEHHKD
jgi:copper(I)-binding protein